MQNIPLREDGPVLKFFRPKIIFPTTMVFHEQKVKNVQILDGAGTTNYLKVFAIGNYD